MYQLCTLHMYTWENELSLQLSQVEVNVREKNAYFGGQNNTDTNDCIIPGFCFQTNKKKYICENTEIY